MAYVTTEDRCSNCGEPLRNAETARLNWQEKACELEKQLAEAQAACAEMREMLKDAEPPQNCGHFTQRNAWTNRRDHALSLVHDKADPFCNRCQSYHDDQTPCLLPR